MLPLEKYNSTSTLCAQTSNDDIAGNGRIMVYQYYIYQCLYDPAYHSMVWKIFNTYGEEWHGCHSKNSKHFFNGGIFTLSTRLVKKSDSYLNIGQPWVSIVKVDASSHSLKIDVFDDLHKFVHTAITEKGNYC